MPNTTMSSSPGPRLIAFHLPQYHPIPENDLWWGTGFTEWTNAAKAKPMFRGHAQPRIPADLGFYDLRLPEAREAQAALARNYGIEAFCFYHYWFGHGKRLLERPVNEWIESGSPDFGFCLCWANESWTGIWHGAPGRTLIEQTYPGEADYIEHFDFLAQAFRDPRYVRVEGRPLFLIYRAWKVPDVRLVLDLWTTRARTLALPRPYFVAVAPTDGSFDARANGFDATVTPRMPARPDWIAWRHPWERLKLEWRKWRQLPTVYRYADIVDELLVPDASGGQDYPCVIPNWDNTPRSGSRGLVLHDSTPELFRRHFRRALEMVATNPPQRQLVFVKSWNEWAEGNYLEPDLAFGRGYLDVVREEVDRIGAARIFK